MSRLRRPFLYGPYIFATSEASVLIPSTLVLNEGTPLKPIPLCRERLHPSVQTPEREPAKLRYVGSLMRKLRHAGFHRRHPAGAVEDIIRAPLCQLDAVLRLARLAGELSNDKGRAGSRTRKSGGQFLPMETRVGRSTAVTGIPLT
jgi:hypothetical protein